MSLSHPNDDDNDRVQLALCAHMALTCPECQSAWAVAHSLLGEHFRFGMRWACICAGKTNVLGVVWWIVVRRGDIILPPLRGSRLLLPFVHACLNFSPRLRSEHWAEITQNAFATIAKKKVVVHMDALTAVWFVLCCVALWCVVWCCVLCVVCCVLCVCGWRGRGVVCCVGGWAGGWGEGWWWWWWWWWWKGEGERGGEEGVSVMLVLSCALRAAVSVARSFLLHLWGAVCGDSCASALRARKSQPKGDVITHAHTFSTPGTPDAVDPETRVNSV